MGNESAKPVKKDSRDLMSIIREKSMRDVLTLSLKRGPLGGYKAEDVVAYSKTVMEQWSVCEKNYNDYIKDLYQQIETLQDELKNKTGEAVESAIEQRFVLFQDEVGVQIDELTEQNAALTNQLGSTQNKLALQTEQMKKLQSENERLNAELNNPARKEPSEPFTEQEALQLNDLLTALEALQAQEAELHNTIAGLEAEKASLQGENGLLTNECSHLTSENEALKAQIAHLQDALDAATAEASHTKHANEELHAKKAELEHTLNVVSAQAAGLQSANATLHVQIAQLEEVKAQDMQFKRTAEELNTQNTALQNEYESAKAELQSLQEQLEAVMQDHSALKAAIETREDAQQESLPEKEKDVQLVSLARGNKELISTIKDLDERNKELLYQLKFIKESFSKVLHLENEKQLQNEQLQQLLAIERSRIRQLVKESWKTSIWNEIDSMLM